MPMGLQQNASAFPNDHLMAERSDSYQQQEFIRTDALLQHSGSSSD